MAIILFTVSIKVSPFFTEEAEKEKLVQDLVSDILDDIYKIKKRPGTADHHHRLG